MSRTATIQRQTAETTISLELNLEGSGVAKIAMKMVDDMVNGVFGGLGFAKRYVAPVVLLLGFILFPATLNQIPFFATVLEIMAFKLGAELMLKNCSKELRIVKSTDVNDDDL